MAATAVEIVATIAVGATAAIAVAGAAIAVVIEVDAAMTAARATVAAGKVTHRLAA